MDEFEQEEQMDRATEIAARCRARCNNMTKEQRDASYAGGMRMIYAHKWTTKRPDIQGQYWIQYPRQQAFIRKVTLEEKGLGFYHPEWIALDNLEEGVKFAGPIEEPI